MLYFRQDWLSQFSLSLNEICEILTSIRQSAATKYSEETKMFAVMGPREYKILRQDIKTFF